LLQRIKTTLVSAPAEDGTRNGVANAVRKRSAGVNGRIHVRIEP
jgi:hypothetical protein